MQPHLAFAAAFGAVVLVASCADNTTPSAPRATQALAIKADDPTLAWGPCPELFPGECNIAVLQGDPSADNADIFLRVGPQYEIPAHSHTSAERMILVTGQLQVTYQGQAPVTLAAGDYAYGPAQLPHRATCVSADPCTLFIAFESPVDAIAFSGSLD